MAADPPGADRRAASADVVAPDPALLADLVTRLPLVTRIDHVGRTGSTNADLLAAGAPGRVLIADEQTAGRGRRGRTWTAPPGTSLLMSLVVRPPLPASTWALLPLVAGSAVIEACRRVLSDVAAARLSLKWPNDLLVDGRKAAGILVEARAPDVVVGIGLNVDWRGLDRPAGVVATSLAEIGDRDIPRDAVVRAVLEALDDHVGRFTSDPTGVVQRYAADCGTIGEQVVARGTAEVRGTAVGLTPDGHLRIRAADGRQHVVTAGDVVHLRPAAEGATPDPAGG